MPAPTPGTSLNFVTDVEKGERYIGKPLSLSKRGLAAGGFAIYGLLHCSEGGNLVRIWR